MTITRQPAPISETKELLLVDLDELRTQPLWEAVELFESAGYLTEDFDEAWEIVIRAEQLPNGRSGRKPREPYRYTRLDTGWLYTTLGVDDKRVLVIAADSHSMALWNPDQLVVVRITDVLTVDLIQELYEYVCPK